VDRLTGVITKVRLKKGYASLRGPDRLSRFFYGGDLAPPADFDILHEGQKVRKFV